MRQFAGISATRGGITDETTIDATFIEAPTSTKNARGKGIHRCITASSPTLA